MSVLKSALMQNFRGYGDKNNVIRFQPGINLILGDNATGKSSIVTLLLFNLLHEKIDVSKFEDYRTLEPVDLKRYKSSLSFIGAKNKEYTIEKILAGKTVRTCVKCDGKEVKKYGELELARHADAQQFVLEKLGVSKEILDNILIQTQDPAKLLWPIGKPRDVGVQLSEILHLQSLQNIYRNAGSCERMLTDKSKEHGEELQKIRAEMKNLDIKPLKTYKTQKIKIEEEVKTLKEQIRQTDSKLRSLQDEKEKKETQINHLREKAGELKQINEEIKEIKSHIARKKKPKKTTTALTHERNGLKLQQDKLRKELQNLDAKIGGLKKSEHQIQKKEQKRAEFEEKIKGVKRVTLDLEKLKSRKFALNKELDICEKNLGNVRENLGELNSAKAKAERKVTKLLIQIENLSKKYDVLSQKLIAAGFKQSIKNATDAQNAKSNVGSKLRELREDIGKFKERTEVGNQYVAILSKAKAICPVCDTKIGKVKRDNILKRKTKELEELKAKIIATSKESSMIEKTTKVLDEMSETLRKLGDLTEEVKSEKKESLKVKQKLPGLHKQKTSFENQRRDLKNKISEVEKFTDLAKTWEQVKEIVEEERSLKREVIRLPHFLELRKSRETQYSHLSCSLDEIEDRLDIASKYEKLEKLKSKNNIIKKQVASLPKLESMQKGLDDWIEQMRERLDEKKGKLRELGPRLETVMQRLKDAQIWHQKLKQQRKKLKATQDFVEVMRLAREAAKVSLYELFRDYQDMINLSLSQIWPVLYPRPDLREIQLEIKIEETEEETEKGLLAEVQLTRSTKSGERISFSTISSHGQRVLASIAFRVAFLNLLSRTSPTIPRILVFDEPTIWVDNDNRERLGHLLANLVEEVREGGINLDQVLVISHDPAFLNAIDPEGVKHICQKNAQGFCEIVGAKV